MGHGWGIRVRDWLADLGAALMIVNIPLDLDRLQREAVKRLNDYIARVAWQHLRRMREKWSAPK